MYSVASAETLNAIYSLLLEATTKAITLPVIPAEATEVENVAIAIESLTVSLQLRGMKPKRHHPETGAQMNTTEYLARCIAADAEASRQALSLINERGYEAQAADRLHEWVETHMTAILSPLVLSNPYPTDWPTWMTGILTEVFRSQVDWNQVVATLAQIVPNDVRQIM